MKTKLLSLVIVLSILLSLSFSLASCNDSDTGSESENSEAPNSSSDSPDDERTNLQKALDELNGVSVAKKELKILSPSPGRHFYNQSGAEENEVYYEEPSDNPLPNAVYRRNMKIYDSLGVEIVPVWAGDTGDISNIVRTNDAAGDKEYYDVILTRLDHSISNAANGYLLNFSDIATIDLEHEWWDKYIVDTFTVFDDHLYVLSGDLNYYDDYAVQIMYFNKDLVADVGGGDLYQLVRDGKWTIDKMVEIASKASLDENADGKFEPGTDIIGIGDNYDAVVHYAYCYGLKLSENDEDGVPSVVWANDKNTSYIDEIYTILTDDSIATVNAQNTHFINNKIVFYGDMLGAITMFRDMQSDFGILPMPKGDSSMERYNAYVSNGWTTVYSIPSVFTSAEAYDTGIILECLSAASKDEVTPALYDQLLQSKYIRDEESKEMLTYILDSKVYDWAGDLSWASTLRDAYNNVLKNGASSFTTALQQNEKQLKKQLEKLAESLLEN